MEKYILALDQGTSSSRSILFNKNQEIVAVEQSELNQFYPQAGWVEQNPYEIWETQFLTAKTLITKYKIKPDQIAGIGITNQRETTIIWDKNTGDPIYNAIVWQDKRTSDYCENLKSNNLEEYVKANTGLVIDSYFSGTKINWILENVDEAKYKAKNGDLLFGTVDTWIIWKLTLGKLHITDYSNASRTMIFNIHKLCWDKKLLSVMNINENILPEIKNSSEIYGYTDKSLFAKEIPIAGIAGDQQAALFGQQCFSVGKAKNTYGTGCFMLMNIGDKISKSKTGMLTTIAWGIENKITYAIEGSVFIAGAAIKWLRDGLKIIRNVNDTEFAAKSVSSNEGVYFVPAFSGLGAPYWNMHSRGIITGLTQGINENHIIRATLEALAYQTKDVLEAMALDSGIKLKELHVDGGVSVNNFLMQFQADILDKNVLRPDNVETTALGAAYLAGIAVDFWNIEELKKKQKISKKYSPKISQSKRNKLYEGWKKAIELCL